MAISCILSNPIPLPCRSVGGVSPAGVYLALWQCPYYASGTYSFGTASGTGLSIPILDSSNVVTGFTSPTASNFYQICQDQEMASLTTKPTVSIENGTAYSETTLTFTILNQGIAENATLNEINAIISGRWRAIVSGNDGTLYYLGLTNPCNVTDASGGPGKAFGDLNGYTITMTSKEQLGPIQITLGAAASVITTAAAAAE